MSGAPPAGRLLMEVPDVSCIVDHLAVLEQSFELLSDQVSKIVHRLNSVNLVPLVSVFSVVSSVVSASPIALSVQDLALDPPFSFSHSFSSVPVLENIVSNLSLSSSKVLTSKVGGLESKLMALDVAIGSILLKGHARLWIADKFDGVCVFVSGLDSGHLGSGVAIIMNNFLAKHVCKVSEISSQLLSVKLLFKNKLSVSVLGLYAGTFLAVRFSQASEINSFVTKAMNDFSFVILGSDFNENGSHRCASFKKCFDLGLINALGGSLFSKSLTWCNSRGVAKMIDYMFISSGLVNAIVDRSVTDVVEFFNTNHKAVSISMDLGGLLDMQLSVMCKQANKDHWKFDVKSADVLKWGKFGDMLVVNASVFLNEFAVAKDCSNLDSMWDVIHRIMVLSTNRTFKKKWFKGYDSVFTKVSSRFYKLELLVSKLVRASHLAFGDAFALLLEMWNKLNLVSVLATKLVFFLGANFDAVQSVLAKARKSYHFFKLLKSKHAEESQIRQAITRHMESFALDKSHTIRSMLKCLFRKVVLDHLIVSDELVLESELVKSRVDVVMEG
ncbi:hypothetical protein G9A89_000761 [Geosiphon pyriformis]|nr:hypothetical protein G9A89_000761 [Geosiphon pyriformis]